jgi:hypothetical protein
LAMIATAQRYSGKAAPLPRIAELLRSR